MSPRDTDGLLTDVFIDILLLNWAVTPLLSDELATVFIVVVVLVGALFFMRRVEAAAGRFAGGGARACRACLRSIRFMSR